VQETHERVDNLLDEFEHPAPKQPSPEPQQEEKYSPSADSGHDTLGELANLNDSGLPVSDSVSSGMRDLSPELTTFDRGPLNIPSAVTNQQQASAPPADDFDDFPHQ
jgi:hypothetical protein